MSKTYIGLVQGKKYYHCVICDRYHYTDSEIGKAHINEGTQVRVRGEENNGNSGELNGRRHPSKNA